MTLSATRAAAFAVFIATACGMPAGVCADPANMRRTDIKGFQIRSEYAISKDNLLEVRRQLWNARREIGQDLGEFPQHTFEVVLAQKSTFHSYTKLPDSISGLFDGRIHIPVPSEPEDKSFLNAVLRHEYTHAVLYLITKGNCPIWLNEGFALYEEARMNPPALTSLKERYALVKKLPYSPEVMDGLLNGLDNRDPLESRIAYEQSYCFVDYLFSRFSAEQIGEFLRELGKGKRFEAAMSETLHLNGPEMESRWERHIAKKCGL